MTSLVVKAETARARSRSSGGNIPATPTDISIVSPHNRALSDSAEALSLASSEGGRNALCRDHSNSGGSENANLKEVDKKVDGNDIWATGQPSLSKGGTSDCPETAGETYLRESKLAPTRRSNSMDSEGAWSCSAGGGDGVLGVEAFLMPEEEQVRTAGCFCTDQWHERTNFSPT